MRTTAGFSLMEVMVSLFISAMILTAVLSTLDSTQKAVDAIHNLFAQNHVGKPWIILWGFYNQPVRSNPELCRLFGVEHRCQ